ncbi:apotyrosinase chaperone MelC1 [Streptomyces sasae]|uniref:apotyrosinase chaperone MelC1 n=1 Tax=Streptomyces sasae TaxID=1266772 RepID=UPI00292EA53F|nr:tyrosinase cofactor [Streptomyces sasae]
MPELTRRHALTVAAAIAATAGTQALVAPGAAAADHRHGGSLEPFDEVYKGRRIQGRPSDDMGGMGGMGGMDGGHHHEHGAGYAVFVDGVELHVMRNADGSWISVVSHYDPVPTPRAAARAAVDELQGAALLPFPAN